MISVINSLQFYTATRIRMVGLRFENVCLRADVEVLLDGMICQGKVKWKGKIHGSYGNWVGLELRNKG